MTATAFLSFPLQAGGCDFQKLQEVIVDYMKAIFLASEDDSEKANFAPNGPVSSCKDIDLFLNQTILVKKDSIFNASVENIDSLFTLTMSFLSFATEEDSGHTKIASIISDVLVSNTSNANPETSEKCLHLLFQLYNLSNKDEDNLGLLLLIKIIQYAKDTNQINIVLPLFEEVEILKAPSLSPSSSPLSFSSTFYGEGYRTLYILLIDCYKALDQSSSPSIGTLPKYNEKIQGLYYAYLLSFEQEIESHGIDKALDNLRQCAICYIENPIQALNANQEYANKKGIKALSQTSNQSPLYNLVQIFSEGNVLDLESFFNAHKDFVEKETTLQSHQLFKDIRLLTIASMANISDKNILTYGEIAKELRIDAEEVEQWVVDAIAEGLIEGKMDQVQEIVEVSKSKGRIINKGTFGKLKNTVQGWKHSVDRMKDVFQAGKAN